MSATKFRILSIALLCHLAVSVLVLAADAPTGVASVRFFENEVRPLLARSCFKCHGPLKQEADLRLDSAAALLAGGLGGPVVVPGDAVASRLFQFVLHDGEVRMPPTGKLDDRSIEVLRKWIDGGVVWPGARARRGSGARGADHWAFRPIATPTPPDLTTAGNGPGANWVRTAVDRFVLARLREKGVHPVGEADRRTWLRRVTQDLTGLPPTVEEMAAYAAATSPDADSRVVDRLLASPAYGERWGRHWMDVARYADTAGETADYPVPPAYRYRNYVIDSFNADKPFDDFAREQLAGDILARSGPPELHAERTVATGFIALSRRFGYDISRYQHMTIQDTIDTVGQAFLGLSLGCARCHDHKYDPVSAADYYGLYGIFASTRYSFPGSEEKKFVRAYLPLVSEVEAEPLREAFEVKARALEHELLKRKVIRDKSFYLASLDDIDGNFEMQAEARGGSEGVPVLPWSYTGSAIMHARSQSPYKNLSYRSRIGLNLAGDRGRHAVWQVLRPAYSKEQTPRLYLGVELSSRTSPPTVTEGKAAITEPLRRLADRTEEEVAYGAYRLALDDGLEGSTLFEIFIRRVEGGRSELVLRPETPDEQVLAAMEADAWYQLRLDLDLAGGGFQGRLERPQTPEQSAVRQEFSGTLGRDAQGRFSVVRFDGEGSPRGVKPCLDVDNLTFSVEPLPALKSSNLRSPVEGRKPETDQEKSEAERLKKEFASLIENGPYPQGYGVVEGNPRDVRIHERGDPELAGESVPRRWLEIFGGDALPAASKGSGRLELAEWIVGKNPLFARVIVNRVWQNHFGQGLVTTPNDFGIRGAEPTHPALLDYLATRLQVDGWSLKRLHRLIVLSSTYRLSSAQNAESYATDPEVRLRWRFERRRLSAEEIRDALLTFGGQLERKVAGPHPFPPMAIKQYSQHGPFRGGDYPTRARSVYMMTQRIHRHPFLSLFDAPERNASFGKRTLTTVPTQALYFMNSPFVHEQSESFARRLPALAHEEAIHGEAEGDADARLAHAAYHVVLGRAPTRLELERVQGFLASYLEAVGQEVAIEEATDETATGAGVAGTGVAGTGVAGTGAEGAAHDVAVPAWAALARVLFSSNEFIYVD